MGPGPTVRSGQVWTRVVRCCSRALHRRWFLSFPLVLFQWRLLLGQLAGWQSRASRKVLVKSQSPSAFVPEPAGEGTAGLFGEGGSGCGDSHPSLEAGGWPAGP